MKKKILSIMLALIMTLTMFNATAVAAPQVAARWAEEALSGYSAYDEFIADTTEPQVMILFSAEGTVRDFKVLKLNFEDVDESGRVMFSAIELYTQDRLIPERPLVLGMTFFGSIPHYGISYVDESGTTRNYAVEMSGKDGSLLMVESNVKTQAGYLGEVFYKGIEISRILDENPEYTLGQPLSSHGPYYTYDGLLVYYTDYVDSVHASDLSLFETGGVTLDKTRSELIAAFGNPIESYQYPSYLYDASVDERAIRYHVSSFIRDYVLEFWFDDPDSKADNIRIFAMDR
jgi:hypothetical protein